MITIIAGDRNFQDEEVLKEAIIESRFGITKVISGGAKGADKLGEAWAERNDIPFEVCEAQWDKHGKSAGPIRNKKMAREFNAEACICILMPSSRGTRSMIKEAREAKLELYVKPVGFPNEGMLRIHGDVLCDVCGNPFRRHPHDKRELDWEGRPFLRISCNGMRLKL
jgi:hypothetical protein